QPRGRGAAREPAGRAQAGEAEEHAMSGYAKRMMEAARPWMAANPVPFAGKVRVPRERNMEWTNNSKDKMARIGDTKRESAARIIEDALRAADRLDAADTALEDAINAA